MKKVLAIFLLLTISKVHSQKPIQNYEQSIFDSDTCCWRKLSSEGRHNEAAELIVEYISHSPNSVNKHSLKWHAGQMYAAAGNNKKAITYYKKTYNIFYKWFGDAGWYYYAKGNVFYLKKDKAKLKKIISKWEKKKPERDINYKALVEMLEKL